MFNTQLSLYVLLIKYDVIIKEKRKEGKMAPQKPKEK